MTSAYTLTVLACLCDTETWGSKLDGAEMWFMTLILISIPVLIMQELILLFMGCPCLFVDDSTTRGKKKRCYNCLRCCSKNTTIFILAALTVIFVVVASVAWSGMKTTDQNEFYWWFVSLFQSWCLWFLKAFMLDFNPSEKFSKSVTCVTRGMLNPGKWLRERERIQTSIREKIKLRGSQAFTSISEAPDLEDVNIESGGGVGLMAGIAGGVAGLGAAVAVEYKDQIAKGVGLA